MNTLSHEHMLPTEKWSEWYRKQEITQSLCSVNGGNGIHCTSDIACKPQNVTMDLKVMLCVLHTVYTLFVSPPYIEIGLCCIPITLVFFFIPTACSKVRNIMCSNCVAVRITLSHEHRVLQKNGVNDIESKRSPNHYVQWMEAMVFTVLQT